MTDTSACGAKVKADRSRFVLGRSESDRRFWGRYFQYNRFCDAVKRKDYLTENYFSLW